MHEGPFEEVSEGRLLWGAHGGARTRSELPREGTWFGQERDAAAPGRRSLCLAASCTRGAAAPRGWCLFRAYQ